MFRSQTDKYSKFDDKGMVPHFLYITGVVVFSIVYIGIPTHDQTGKPLSDKQVRIVRMSQVICISIPTDQETPQVVAGSGEETCRTPKQNVAFFTIVYTHARGGYAS